jgi:hypothetical protein
MLALLQDSLAAGLRLSQPLINNPGARERRDNARIANLLFPGSGNVVSGDWNNITQGDIADIADLVLSLASTAVPPGRVAGPARAAIRAARSISEAEGATAAAQAAARGVLASGAPVAGKLDAPAPLELTGQFHHAISKPIHNALEEHFVLKGLYQHRDPRFITRAIDQEAHRGYQGWHRDLDGEMAAHIRNSRFMTPAEFEHYLWARYAQPDLIARFPNALKGESRAVLHP